MIVFVSGPPRSGTTLLNGVLSGGTAYPMLPECTLMTAIIRNRLHFLVTKDPKRLRPYVGSDEILDQIIERQLEEILQHTESGFEESRRVLVLKDPYLLHVLMDLRRFFRREIRAICIVRDPRDVVASLSAVFVRERGGYDLTQLLEMLAPFYIALAEVFTKHASVGYPTLLVRYEDLVDPRTDTLDLIEGFCGYPIDRVGYGEMSADSLDPASPWFVETYGRPIVGDRIGQFRQALSPDEIARVETAFGPTLERYGYR